MDLSFLKFYRSLTQDLFESNATQTTKYNDVHLSPLESYTFITNIKDGYALLPTNTMNFVNCKGEILGVAEFNVTQINGSQFIWELKPSSLDFTGKEVRLSLNNELFTSPFIYSQYRIKETIRIDFKHSDILDGTRYNALPVYQSIRIKCWFVNPYFDTSMAGYIADDGDGAGESLSARVIKTLKCKFTADFLSNNTYLALSHALSCDTIYINKKRELNQKFTILFLTKKRLNLNYQ
jgi:hypothetical protein